MGRELERLRESLADRYSLQRELGRGGMAIVYLAQDLKHDRTVALKVLRSELADSIGAQRFLREIRLTAQLDHPHILPLLDSGEAHGFIYYVMPYVEGESLRDRLNRDRLMSLDDARQIISEVADALGYAHSRGVIHRDIKPENILLAAGHARVADFGIARAISAVGQPTLTATGIAIGTPLYMSPEQVAGDPTLDGRSDLYSLACVLYEMLAGQPPFAGPTVQAILAKRLVEPAPSLRTVRADVPADLDTTIQRALAPSPSGRFSQLADFRDALRPAPDERMLTPRRREWLFVMITLLCTVAFGSLLLTREGRARPLELLAVSLPIAIALRGWRATRGRKHTARSHRQLELQASFESGLYGGLIGGALGGLFIGPLYAAATMAAGFRQLAAPWFVAQTILVGTLAGAVFGATILGGVSWLRYLAGNGGLLRNAAVDFIGAIAGAVLGGGPVGVLVTLIFALQHVPAVSGPVMFTGTALIGGAIVAGTLLYDYRGRIRRLVLPLVGGAVVTTFAVVLTIAFFPYQSVVDTYWLATSERIPTPAGVSVGGLIVGAVAGLMLGSQIGGTMALHRLWSVTRSVEGEQRA